VVTGIEPTTSGLLDQRRSHSDNQAPYKNDLTEISHSITHSIQGDPGNSRLVKFRAALLPSRFKIGRSYKSHAIVRGFRTKDTFVPKSTTNITRHLSQMTRCTIIT